jgi:hypothetical protein
VQLGKKCYQFMLFAAQRLRIHAAQQKGINTIRSQPPHNPGLNEAEKSPLPFGKRVVTLAKKPVIV